MSHSPIVWGAKTFPCTANRPLFRSVIDWFLAVPQVQTNDEREAIWHDWGHHFQHKPRAGDSGVRLPQLCPTVTGASREVLERGIMMKWVSDHSIIHRTLRRRLVISWHHFSLQREINNYHVGQRPRNWEASNVYEHEQRQGFQAKSAWQKLKPTFRSLLALYTWIQLNEVEMWSLTNSSINCSMLELPRYSVRHLNNTQSESSDNNYDGLRSVSKKPHSATHNKGHSRTRTQLQRNCVRWFLLAVRSAKEDSIRTSLSPACSL